MIKVTEECSEPGCVNPMSDDRLAKGHTMCRRCEEAYEGLVMYEYAELDLTEGE